MAARLRLLVEPGRNRLQRVIHAAGDASYIILAGSGIAMASLIFGVSLAIFGFGLLPRWVGWFGVVAGIAAIFSLFFFFTMLVWLLWIAVTAVMLFVRSRSRAHAPAGASEPIRAV